MRRRNFCLTLFWFPILAGCQTTDKGAPPEAKAAVPRSPHPISARQAPASTAAPRLEARPVLQASVIASSVPNAYSVVLEWNGIAADPEAWTIGRQEQSPLHVPIATLSGGVHRYTDRAVEVGRTYQYQLTAGESMDAEPLETISVTIPRDLFVTGTQTLGAVREINRLFLPQGSHLIAEGGSLAVEVNELHADGGIIETFPSGAQAMAGQNGRSAGLVHLHAKKALGVLRLFARGENGGIGLTGMKGADGGPGAPGMPCAGWCYLAPAQITGGESTKAIACRDNPGRGSAGDRGKDGAEGGAGGKGGDSPAVLVAIDEASGFQIIPKVEPGKGGEGGMGGAPGSGGPGGPPYPADAPALCRQGSSGPKGADGQTGKRGSSGADGRPNALCIKLGQAALGECESFEEKTHSTN